MNRRSVNLCTEVLSLCVECRLELLDLPRQEGEGAEGFADHRLKCAGVLLGGLGAVLQVAVVPILIQAVVSVCV